MSHDMGQLLGKLCEEMILRIWILDYAMSSFIWLHTSFYLFGKMNFPVLVGDLQCCFISFNFIFLTFLFFFPANYVTNDRNICLVAFVLMKKGKRKKRRSLCSFVISHQIPWVSTNCFVNIVNPSSNHIFSYTLAFCACSLTPTFNFLLQCLPFLAKWTEQTNKWH